MCILIADNVHPLVVQHDWGECHNFREASARPEDHPIGGAAAGEGKKNTSQDLSHPLHNLFEWTHQNDDDRDYVKPTMRTQLWGPLHIYTVYRELQVVTVKHLRCASFGEGAFFYLCWWTEEFIKT